MFELTGKYNKAKIFTDDVDQNCVSQIIYLLNQEFAANSQIRMMPDAHAGIGCVIGTTMTIQDKICPNLVGVDIGCGMEVVELQETDIDLKTLDKIIHEHIPAGAEVNTRTSRTDATDNIPYMKFNGINQYYAERYMGTLGGGNHFIEIDRDESTGKLYLIIHSGSRAVGRKTAEYYQNQAYDQMRDADKMALREYTQSLRRQGYKSEIPKLVAERKQVNPNHIDKDIAYLTSYLFDDYMHDMKIVQEYADKNRQTIAQKILKHAGLHMISRFATIHNYIDVEQKILRKGAVSANTGEKFIIPLNMRDGALICIGKGNPDWNFSAPHGAGRILSRREAKTQITMAEYQTAMDGIFSTSISQDTLDESPMAYKNAEGIIANIVPTAEIMRHIRPIYNFKAGRQHNPGKD